MQHSCTVCRKAFESSRSHARYCSSTCRGKALKARKASAGEVTPIGVVAQGVVASLSSPPATEPEGLVGAITRELTAAGKLDTYGGQKALIVAGRMQKSGLDTGSAVAALSKELDRLMDTLMADVRQEPDAIDDAQAAVVSMRTRRSRG